MLSAEQLSALGLTAFIGLIWVGFMATQGRNWRAFSRPNSENLPTVVQYVYAGTNWCVGLAADLCVRFDIKPDTLSWFGFFMGVLTAGYVGMDLFAIGLITLYLSGVFDVMDGQVAKRTGSASLAGGALDSFLDRSVDYCYYAGAIWLWQDYPVLVLLALAALHGSSLVSYTTAQAEKYQLELPRGGMRRAERGGILLISIALSALTRELERGWDTFPAIPLAIGILVIAVLSNYEAFRRLAMIRSMLREQERMT